MYVHQIYIIRHAILIVPRYGLLVKNMGYSCQVGVSSLEFHESSPAQTRLSLFLRVPGETSKYAIGEFPQALGSVFHVGDGLSG